MIHNPTPYRPRLASSASLTHPALRGVTVSGHLLDLPVPAGLRLPDALPVPAEAIADLEIDLADGSTLTVAVDDPDLAAAQGWIRFDGDGLGIAVP